MYKAVFYVGGKRPGEMIPDGMLTKERAAELEAMGAIEKIGPFFLAEDDDSSDEEIDVAGGKNSPSVSSAATSPYTGEAAVCENETDDAVEIEAEAPEIDLMDAIVEEDAPQEPASKRGRGSRSK